MWNPGIRKFFNLVCSTVVLILRKTSFRLFCFSSVFQVFCHLISTENVPEFFLSPITTLGVQPGTEKQLSKQLTHDSKGLTLSIDLFCIDHRPSFAIFTSTLASYTSCLGSTGCSCLITNRIPSSFAVLRWWWYFLSFKIRPEWMKWLNLKQD